MYRLLFLLIFIFSIFTAKSQYLIFPGTNALVKNQSKLLNEKDLRANDTLKVPFFDDFSRPTIYPNSKLWSDNFAFVNQTLAVNPPSIGVATLDAISFDGSIYETSSTYGFVADFLTSKPIYLNFPADTSIYFSFMYQAQGLGDAPENGDSLILEFYSPTDLSWNKIWSINGSELHNFKKVIIPISESKYLKSGFQFRFKNIASFSSNTDYAGRRSNCDYWNIDWVYLNKYRSAADTILNDVAFIQPLKSLLKSYESVPWKHFHTDTTAFFKSTAIKTTLENHFTEQVYSNLTYEISNIKTNEQSFYKNIGSIPDFFPGTKEFEETIENVPFPYIDEDSVSFKIKVINERDTVSATQIFRYNDTLTYYQKFENYYAYDDGSAEAGFGMDGNQTEGAKAAIQFSAEKKDTLRAVQFYFNKIYENPLEGVQFYLCIWTDLNNEPIYKSAAISPLYNNELNNFQNYKLENPLLIDGKFYVGWEQIESKFLNIGFDLNNDASSKLLYNIYGTWQNFPTSGSLMIRPVFGTENVLDNVVEITNENNVVLFPNPTSNKINIRSNEYFKISEIEIFDISGRKLKSSFETENIDVSDFSKGIYFVKIHNSSDKAIIKKIVVE